MKPDTQFNQLTAREVAEMLAWHAKLCQREDFINVEHEIGILFALPPPHVHEYRLTRGSNADWIRASCECGQYSEALDMPTLLRLLNEVGGEWLLK